MFRADFAPTARRIIWAELGLSSTCVKNEKNNDFLGNSLSILRSVSALKKSVTTLEGSFKAVFLISLHYCASPK